MGLFWLCVRILGGVAVLAVVAFGGLLACYFLLVLPHQQAAFDRLSGPARRLAIYDAATARIDRNYFDQGFSRLRLAKLRREWRAKAAKVDDNKLYPDIIFQMTQRFPASHVEVFAPRAPASQGNTAATSLPADAPCTARDIGFGVVDIRRGKDVLSVVGEVWPELPAARAGVTPGWLVDSMREDFGPPTNHVKAAFLRMTPAQMHVLENTGALDLLPESVTDSSEAQAAVEGPRQPVAFDFPCGAPAEPFETRRLASGAVYIRFDAFNTPLIKQVEAPLETADDRGAILDLRFNRGGETTQGLNLLLP